MEVLVVRVVLDEALQEPSVVRVVSVVLDEPDDSLLVPALQPIM